MHAAAAVYGRGRDPGRPLLIGSVKTNIGHLEAAAGVAGLIKILLSMERGTIPPHVNFRSPNPRIEWDRLPVRVPCDAAEWPRSGTRPALAAVSSFGLSGTNAHIVVEGAADGLAEPGPAEEPASRRIRMLPLSGKTGAAVRQLASRYSSWIEQRLGIDAPDSGAAGLEETLADAAWTASVGRSHFEHRAGLVFGEVSELRLKLES